MSARLRYRGHLPLSVREREVCALDTARQKMCGTQFGGEGFVVPSQLSRLLRDPFQRHLSVGVAL